jgi:hypothetical protein
MMSPDSPGSVLSPRVENDRVAFEILPRRLLVHAGLSSGCADSVLALGSVSTRALRNEPVPPIGVPALISLAFWGGIWGIAIWPLLRHAAGAAYWLRALLIGAVGPSAVALFVVFPLKGMGVAGGWDPKIIVVALILNGAWGLGVALLMNWMSRE